ncbi:MAG TPA: efflux RND transporter periplasmic adaptor subunit [Planctomycetota bacterium]
MASALLLLVVVGTGGGLFAWKHNSHEARAAESAAQPEHSETVAAATAVARAYRRTTTSIGTVIALRSITLHNELAGSVHSVNLVPGAIVEPGTVLVALDVAVEEAELQAQQAQAALAGNVLERMSKAMEKAAASALDVDRARAERDVALAQVERIKAVIARKTIKAPFRARVGMADVHEGQFLREGTQLTTLQGLDDQAHIDFMVTQAVAAGLQPGDVVDAFPVGASAPVPTKIVAVDARVDPNTRNAKVRVAIDNAQRGAAPGASVRVQVPVGPKLDVVTVPVSALRKGPAGDHVFVIAEQDGKTRAQLRPVQSGSMLGDDVVILDGLKPGERVAAAGSFKLYPFALVNVKDENGATPGGSRN